jgi:hypothetical protein
MATLALDAFEASVGSDLIVRPSELEFTTEIGLGSMVLVERGWVSTTAPPLHATLRTAKLPCAIKSIRPDILFTPAEVSALIAEVRANKALQHK